MAWLPPDRVLKAIVWYPADPVSVEVPQNIGPPDAPLFTAGRAALDARPAPSLQGFPLIALSHGSGGSAAQMAWLGASLAAHGYIAAAVDHPGNNSNGKYTVEGFTLWWERARDISVLIDRMLADSVFRERIDKKRIGAAGFSLGGYTMMLLAGAVSDPALFQSFCNGPRRGALCNDLPEFPGLNAEAAALAAKDPAYRASLARAGQSYRDPRIRAVFAIAPALGPAFSPQSLAAIRIPVDIVAGAADDIVPIAANAEYFAGHIRGAKLTILPGGVAHYTFLDTCTQRGRETVVPFCRDQPGVDRDKVHAEVAAMAVAFFRKQLK